jgi:hypothetical protein
MNLKKYLIRVGSRINGAGDVLKTGCAMTNDEQKKVIKLCLMGSILVMLLISGMACILYEKLVWTGILFVTVGVANIFFLGLPFTIFLIIAGLTIISFGYEERVLGLTLGALGLVIVWANVILMYKSIASGGLERLEILAKSNRFAFIDYLRKNDITCILWNKLKRKIK